jgi:hypothetical protein
MIVKAMDALRGTAGFEPAVPQFLFARVAVTPPTAP